MKDWDFIADDPQQREPKPVGVCASCGKIIYYDYFKGWYDCDPRALICPECIENVIEELWNEYMIDEKLEAVGMTHELY